MWEFGILYIYKCDPHWRCKQGIYMPNFTTRTTSLKIIIIYALPHYTYNNFKDNNNKIIIIIKWKMSTWSPEVIDIGVYVDTSKTITCNVKSEEQIE